MFPPYQLRRLSQNSVRWILSVFFIYLKYNYACWTFFGLYVFRMYSFFLNLSSAEIQLSMVYNWLLWLKKITSDGNLKGSTKHTVQLNKLKLICMILYFNGTPYITLNSAYSTHLTLRMHCVNNSFYIFYLRCMIHVFTKIYIVKKFWYWYKCILN